MRLKTIPGQLIACTTLPKGLFLMTLETINYLSSKSPAEMVFVSEIYIAFIFVMFLCSKCLRIYAFDSL